MLYPSTVFRTPNSRICVGATINISKWTSFASLSSLLELTNHVFKGEAFDNVFRAPHCTMHVRREAYTRIQLYINTPSIITSHVSDRASPLVWSEWVCWLPVLQGFYTLRMALFGIYSSYPDDLAITGMLRRHNLLELTIFDTKVMKYPCSIVHYSETILRALWLEKVYQPKMSVFWIKDFCWTMSTHKITKAFGLAYGYRLA